MIKVFTIFMIAALAATSFFASAADPILPFKDWNPKAKNAVIGAAGGSVLGAIINKKNRVKGAVIGGVIGGGLGYAYGVIRNKQKQKQAAKRYAENKSSYPAKTSTTRRTGSKSGRGFSYTPSRTSSSPRVVYKTEKVFVTRTVGAVVGNLAS